jgi:hypothetical protein|tara:strand:- start:33 stop:290 length:258 start_codon:yes stop_codon:yes gene_type:complete
MSEDLAAQKYIGYRFIQWMDFGWSIDAFKATLVLIRDIAFVVYLAHRCFMSGVGLTTHRCRSSKTQRMAAHRRFCRTDAIDPATY